MTATSNFQNPHLDSAPFFLPGGATGVLLIHGFTATPVEVKLVAEHLHQRGYTVAGPRLPGHGTTVEELNRCTWRDWTDHVTQAYAELASHCEQVFVGGESMGGLLALYLGSKYPEIAGLVAYAPALRAASRLIHLTPLLKHFIKILEKNRPGDDPHSIVNQRWQGYTVDPLPAAAQLLALQRQVKRRLAKITQPLLVMQGRLDTTLDIRGAQQVMAQVNSTDKELLWFERSTHCLILDVEWEAAAEKTLAFFQRIDGQAAAG
jgi:carboxylesterase